MSQSDLMSIHVHPLFAVPKPGALARVVVHMSKGTRRSPSYNESVDVARHQARYPRPRLPQLGDFADMFHAVRVDHPHCGHLHAAIVDCRSAFQQYHHSFPKFKLVWVRAQIYRDGAWVHVLVGYVCGTFGDTGAGDTFDTPASTLNAILNAGSTLWTSIYYVDDSTIAAPPVASDVAPRTRPFFPEPRLGAITIADGLDRNYSPSYPYAILDAVRDARDNLAKLFGPDSSEDRKTKLFVGCCETVGWYFDLRYSHWTARPIMKKLEKIAYYLFCVIPPDARTTTLHNMQSLAGLLCWYAVAIPIAKSFVYTLFQCNRAANGTVFIHDAAYRDLTFWRATIRVALDFPDLLACPIDYLRTDRSPSWYIVTDACTGIGGGSWISSSPTWRNDSDALWFALRWTKDEGAAIASRLLPYNVPAKDAWPVINSSFLDYTLPDTPPFDDPLPKVNINVLEFATAVFTIMAAAPKLRNCVVSLGADNTATLCWLVRNRSAAGAADT